MGDELAWGRGGVGRFSFSSPSESVSPCASGFLRVVLRRFETGSGVAGARRAGEFVGMMVGVIVAGAVSVLMFPERHLRPGRDFTGRVCAFWLEP